MANKKKYFNSRDPRSEKLCWYNTVSDVSPGVLFGKWFWHCIWPFFWHIFRHIPTFYLTFLIWSSQGSGARHAWGPCVPRLSWHAFCFLEKYLLWHSFWAICHPYSLWQPVWHPIWHSLCHPVWHILTASCLAYTPTFHSGRFLRFSWHVQVGVRWTWSGARHTGRRSPTSHQHLETLPWQVGNNMSKSNSLEYHPPNKHRPSEQYASNPISRVYGSSHPVNCKIKWIEFP